MRHLPAFLLALGAAFPAFADTTAGDLGPRVCATIAARVDAIPGDGPAFLSSYDPAEGGNPDPVPPGTAFTYDNALAAIALLGCDKRAQAERIGGALVLATTSDRSGDAGRVRNAYRAGPQTERPIPPMGWWDAKAGVWFEDAYQVGSATGNVAWAALALSALHHDTGKPEYLTAATRAAEWAAGNTRDPAGPGGFNGGLQGFDTNPQRLTWKSTEHNTDLWAVFSRLDRAGVAGPWRERAGEARRFLDAMWAAGGDHFVIGTTPDGVTINRATAALDTQLWPLMPEGAPEAWRSGIRFAERTMSVGDGFDFNDDRDGLWLEGTAQAASAYRIVGRKADADRLFATITANVSSGGYVYATPNARLTTGLGVGPDSAEADFFYFHIPHLGATAWAALATTGMNPFSGKRGP